MVIYLLILIIVIALVVILTRYMAKSYKAKQTENEKERIAKEEQIQVVIQQINIDNNNVLPYLDEALLHKDHYFTFSEKEKFLETTKDLYRKIKSIESEKSFKTLDDNVIRLYEAIKNIEFIRATHNKDFIQRELENNREFFDSALNYPLDNQQRESIVKLEDNCLVVSSAGSGKTSTMIGKLLYLVHQRKIQPARILTITYTHKRPMN